MAAERGRQVPSVIDQLFADPRKFDFFEAVRLLEGHARTSGAEGPTAGALAGREPVGHDSPLEREVVRFRTHQSLTFATSTIERLTPPDQTLSPKAAVPEMHVNFLGLTGASGVLPRHYTHLVLQQMRESEKTLAEFLDLFNHRLISLFYRAWEKYRAAPSVERGLARREDSDLDLFTYVVSCLVGLGTDGLRDRMAVRDDVLRYYSGAFAQRPPKAVSLQGMLGEHLEAQVRVRQFRGRWLQLSPADQTKLPGPGQPPTIAAQLGMGAVAGDTVWDVQSMFRVRIGPVDYAFFRRMMPSGDRLLPLCQLIRAYAGPEFEFDVQVVLHRREVPACKLDGGAQLGWNTWVRCGEFDRDVDDGVFSLPQV
jgi:type VI secretion system protein ImpH